MCKEETGCAVVLVRCRSHVQVHVFVGCVKSMVRDLHMPCSEDTLPLGLLLYRE